MKILDKYVPTEEDRLAAWLISPKRMSRHCNDLFATRRDRQCFDRQFLNQDRPHVRPHPEARRAKAIRE